MFTYSDHRFLVDVNNKDKVHFPQFSGQLEKPNVYGQQEVFHCQKKTKELQPGIQKGSRGADY